MRTQDGETLFANRAVVSETHFNENKKINNSNMYSYDNYPIGLADPKMIEFGAIRALLLYRGK